MMSGLPKAALASRRRLRGVKHVANVFRNVVADRIGVDKRGVLIGCCRTWPPSFVLGLQ
jgi:hypothetical protein